MAGLEGIEEAGADVWFAPGDFPITERIAARTLALPFSNQITDEQLDEVCETLLALMAQRAPTS